MLVPLDVGHAQRLEQDCHQTAAYKHAEHGLPGGDACPEQQNGTQGNGNDAGLTNGTGNKAADHIAERSLRSYTLGHLAQRSGSREAIGQRVTQSEDAVGSHPGSIACHYRRIREEEEHTCGDGHIEDVHTRTTKDFLGENHGKGHGQGQHPQRTVDGNNKRNDDTADEVALLNLLPFPLGHDELNAKAYDVTDENLRQHGQEAVAEDFEE